MLVCDSCASASAEVAIAWRVESARLLAASSLALALSHTSPCGPPAPLVTGATPMKAVVRRCYGSPDVVRYEDIAKPTPKDDELLVKVHAASVNPLDWHELEGTPYLVRTGDGLGKPENPRIGVDFAGTVEQSSHRRWKAGETGRIDRDGKARLSNLIGIHKALRIIFREPQRGYAWMRKANTAFAGRSAVEVMLGGELTDLMRVRHYLDAERGGW